MKLEIRFTLILAVAVSYISGVGAFAQEWQLYNTANSALNHNWVLSLAQDHNNDIWIGSVGGLNGISGSTWSSFTTDNSGMPRNEIRDIEIAGDNAVWMSIPFSNALNQPGAITKYDGASWSTYVPTGNMNYRKIDIDEDQNVWIAVSGYSIGGHHQVEGHLVKMSPTGSVLNVYTADNTPFPWYVSTFRSVLAGEDGIIWAGSQDGGLGKLDGNEWTIYSPQNSGIPGYNINDIVLDRDGILWVATTGGLGRYDIAAGEWTSFNEHNSPLPISQIMCVAVDSLENLWAGTLNGLVKFDGENWTVYNSGNSGLPPPSPSTPGYEVIEAILVDNEGKKWIGTRNGLAVYNDIVTNVEEPDLTPVSYRLDQNYPNPFNPNTTIGYTLPVESNVRITVYNVLGERVTDLVSEVRQPGFHTAIWDAGAAASGVYFYTIEASSIDRQQNFRSVQTMTLLK